MNIKILDSWLREHLKTKASPQQIAEKLSLTSVSVERIEKIKNDFVYDIEITTNRPDLMSVVGLAREAATVLTQNKIPAVFNPPTVPNVLNKPQKPISITIKNDPKLVNRICAVIMDVKIKPTPKIVQERLESTDIRSLNNLIDITNYVMRVIGHPTHAFDYDRLQTNKITIRESRKGEKIKTLDDKQYSLPGGDIIAEDDKGNIIDLLSIMGLENSAVTDDTKRILYFIDNVEPNHIRKTSMSLGIRTEAAVLNEKGVNPELAGDAFLYGIKLFQELADGKIISEFTDIYPNKIKKQTVTVSEKQIQSVIGVPIVLKQAAEILSGLGFETKIQEENLITTPPSFRAKDIEIPEDIIEEIARVYGYHNIPNTLPALAQTQTVNLEKDEFYWEDRIKDALKYWGFTEVYTYPMVSEDMYEGPVEAAVTIQNPLSEDFVHMRKTLIPSLLKVIKENPDHDVIKIFEIANVYLKKPSASSGHNLPEQIIKLAGVIKKPKITFYHVKGFIEQLLDDLGIKQISWKQLEKGGIGTTIYINKDMLGDIEVLDGDLINFELNFQTLLRYATLKKTYKPVSKYPPIVEDLAIIAPTNVPTGELMETIKKQSPLIIEVSLLDKYQDTRTFHIVYQSYQKNLTDKEVGEIREKILKVLQDKFQAKLKE